MLLATGTRLGPYEVLARIGAGGMGEVYKARDTRLDRTVALKVLPPHLADDPEFRARFEREARTISQLNHPHICTLHDVGRHGEVEYLVLEHLDGETLAARLGAGPLPLDEALDLGRQVCDALDAAHRAGIVHRDLKPANVMLARGTRRPQATLLDFGLAKPASPALATSFSRDTGTAAPTQSAPLTGRGAMLGTVGYMAPEQIEGLDADARTDIWAFGCLLYEMLTARRAFDASTPASAIGAILKDPAPSVAARDPLAPPALDRLIRTCLEKSPDDRWQSARDLGRELGWIADAASAAHGGVPAEVAAAAAGGSGRSVAATSGRWPWTVAGAACAVAIGALAWGAGQRPAAPIPVEFDFGSRATHSTELDSGDQIGALSPDGQAVAFPVSQTDSGSRGLCIRALDRAEPRCLENTADAVRPFWSPDGRQVAYFANGRLWVVGLDGGQPRAITDAGYGVGGAWSPAGVIVFAPAFGRGLLRVAASGGVAAPLTELDASRGESIHAWPTFLPDGRRFLFVSRTTASAGNRIEMAALDDPTRHVVAEADSLVGVVMPWLVFARRGGLFAQRLGPDGRRVIGDPVVIRESVNYSESWVSTGASVGGDTLTFVPYAETRVQAKWFGADGRPGGTAFEDTGVHRIRLSPDGRSVLVQKWSPEDGADDIWTVDIATQSRARLTRTRADEDLGTWSHDGTSVFFNTDDLGMYAVMTQRADGFSKAQLLLSTPATDWNAVDVTPDGRELLTINDSADQLHLVNLARPGAPKRWVESDFVEDDGRFSRDGAWVAFSWSRSGTQEVYVRSRTGGVATQVSTGGGRRSAWAPGGRRVYYIGTGGRLFAVDLTQAAGRLVPDRPALVLADAGLQDFDVGPDGRLLVLSRSTELMPTLRARVGWKPR